MKTYTYVNSVFKTFDIIDYLSDQRTPKSAAEIARDLEMPGPTVWSHLATLDRLGVLQQVGEHWKIGMKLALYWARVKSGKEGEIDSIRRDLELLETGERG